MAVLTKRVQVLLSPSQWESLQRLSKEQGCSVGSLIREAIEIVYLGKATRETALKAVKVLAGMELPVSDWEQMERESSPGGPLET